RVLFFTVVGLITGAFSAVMNGLFAHAHGDAGLWALHFWPGAIFGALFALVLVRRRRVSPPRAVAWFACSTLAYTIATFGVLILVRRLEDLLAMHEAPAIALSGVVAGTLGGGLLAGATRLLIPDTRWLIPTAVGAILGLALVLLDEPMSVGTFAFYM